MSELLRRRIADYVVRCFHRSASWDVGTEGNIRRIFRWKEGGKRFEGNTRSFSRHVAQKFGLKMNPAQRVNMVSRIMLQEGFRVRPEHTRDKGGSYRNTQLQKPYKREI